TVGQDRHHARAAPPRRIVDRSLGEAVRLELLHPGLGEAQHVGLGAELQAAGGTGLDAGGLQADAHPVDAQRALRHLARARLELRDVEGAARLAIATADALLGVHVDDAVFVL